MPDKYVPVSHGLSSSKPKNTRKSSKTVQHNSSALKDRTTVDHLTASDDTYDKIKELSSIGYAASTVGYLLGADEALWKQFYNDEEQFVNRALKEGKILLEIETVGWLRHGAWNCNNYSALKLYGEIFLGWGNNGSTIQELPTGITFDLLEGDDNGS